MAWGAAAARGLERDPLAVRRPGRAGGVRPGRWQQAPPGPVGPHDADLAAGVERDPAPVRRERRGRVRAQALTGRSAVVRAGDHLAARLRHAAIRPQQSDSRACGPGASTGVVEEGHRDPPIAAGERGLRRGGKAECGGRGQREAGDGLEVAAMNHLGRGRGCQSTDVTNPPRGSSGSRVGAFTRRRRPPPAARTT